MKKKKKLCYKCNKFRYLRGFTGKGKRRNKMCNLCLFKNSRKLIYMSIEELDLKNNPSNPKTEIPINYDNIEWNEKETIDYDGNLEDY